MVASPSSEGYVTSQRRYLFAAYLDVNLTAYLSRVEAFSNVEPFFKH
jgi:hypothetical protein